jgi:hypothetical protein
MNRFIPSDERIKECICPSKDLLPKLDQINFVEYDMISDNISHQDVGIIAQNVIQVFPKMVSLTSNYLPNILQKAEHTLMADDIVFIRMTNTLPLKENDDVSFHINPSRGDISMNHSSNIIHATDVSIEIKKWRDYNPNDELLIYGSMIDDYHAVDMTQIGILGAACAKELYHMVKCQAETIASLNGTCAALQKQIDDLSARLS